MPYTLYSFSRGWEATFAQVMKPLFKPTEKRKINSFWRRQESGETGEKSCFDLIVLQFISFFFITGPHPKTITLKPYLKYSNITFAQPPVCSLLPSYSIKSLYVPLTNNDKVESYN